MDPLEDKKIPDFFANRTQIQPETEEDEGKSEVHLQTEEENFDEVPYDFRAEYKEKIERTFAFDDEDDEKKFSSIRLHAIGLGLLIGVLVALLASVLLFGSDEENDVSEPVVVTESQRPVKVRPTNPAGMEVPDQDKTIYKRVRSEETDTKVERLVVVEELPVRPQVPTREGLILGTPKAMPQSSQEMELEVLSVQQKAVQIASSKPVKINAVEETVEKESVSIKEKPASQPVLKIQEETKPQPVSKEVKKTQTITEPEWYVQLISLPSKSGAEKAWPKILKAHSSLLSGLSHDVAEVQIKGRGTFYRLRVGSFKDKKDAQRLCNKLKNRKQDCTLTK